MPDRKKVIKEFELFIKKFHPACTSEGVELDMLREVLALLKEQPEIVRCENCKHHGKGTCSAGAGIAFPTPDDWFCADGERKECR